MGTKVRNPFVPLHITGKGGLATAEDLNRVEDLIRLAFDQLLNGEQLKKIIINTGGGKGGQGGVAVPFGDSEYIADDAGGAETWLAERMFPFGSFPGSTCTLTLVALALSTGGGAATFRVRTGGTTAATGGNLVATLTSSAASYTKLEGTFTIPNPGDSRLLTITGQPAAAGQKAKITSLLMAVGP